MQLSLAHVSSPCVAGIGVSCYSTKSVKMGVDADAHLQLAVAGDIKRSSGTRKGSMFSSKDLDNVGK